MFRTGSSVDAVCSYPVCPPFAVGVSICVYIFFGFVIHVSPEVSGELLHVCGLSVRAVSLGYVCVSSVHSLVQALAQIHAMVPVAKVQVWNVLTVALE